MVLSSVRQVARNTKKVMTKYSSALPGQTASIKIPFLKTETLSDKILVIVKAMSE